MANGEPEPQDQPEQAAVRGKFTWTAYYKSKEGFGESIVIATDSAKELQNARGGMVLWLQMMEAETQPRDKEGVKTGGWGRPTQQPSAQGGAPAAPPANGGGISPVCPNDGAGMVLKPGGVSGPRSANPGKAYGPFWSCVNYPNCKGRANS